MINRNAPQTPISAAPIAVLTGDFIGSSLWEPDRLAAARAVIAQECTAFDGVLAGGPDFFRGDSWQAGLGAPALALRLALRLRMALQASLGADTRIAIGLGAADHINAAQISLSSGEAFSLSGRALDELGAPFELALALPARAGALRPWAAAAVRMAGGLAGALTRRQAAITRLALAEARASHKALGRALDPPVTQQAVSAALAGAHWRLLHEAVSAFEACDWPLVLAADR